MPHFFVQLLIVAIAAAVRLFTYNSRSFRLGSAGDDYYYRNRGVFGWIIEFIQKRNRRITALKKAQNYLQPYEKIFGNLTLSNKFCTLTFYNKDKRFMCLSNVYDNQGRKMMLYASDFAPMTPDEYFDMLCDSFNYGTNYAVVYNFLRSISIINESVYSVNPEAPASVDILPDESKQAAVNIKEKNDKREVIDLTSQTKSAAQTERLTDVNNCSEAELTALPGINVVFAKKVINFRENERPFKSVEDFITVMNIKPHFAKQIRKIICVNKVNMKKVKKAKSERIIDI